jgi:hypothetical protein
MDPRSISGIHVTMSFTIQAHAHDLTPAFDQATKVRDLARGLPNVTGVEFHPTVVLGGTGVMGERYMKGIAHAVTEDEPNGE